MVFWKIARLTQKNRERTQIKPEMKNETLQQIPQRHKGSKKNNYASISNNLEEMSKFLDTFNLSRLWENHNSKRDMYHNVHWSTILQSPGHGSNLNVHWQTNR